MSAAAFERFDERGQPLAQTLEAVSDNLGRRCGIIGSSADVYRQVDRPIVYLNK
jgi:hypothetical protein